MFFLGRNPMPARLLLQLSDDSFLNISNNQLRHSPTLIAMISQHHLLPKYIFWSNRSMTRSIQDAWRAIVIEAKPQ